MTLSWLIGLLLAATDAAPGPDPPTARRAVVLTTDCGCEVDDQWALAHLALSPELDLRGIVTTHAPNLPPPAAESAARVAREVLDHLPRAARPPVLPGSSVPLADRAKPLANAGVTFLLEQARGHSPADRLHVLMIGAATDVASALLTDPSWADRVTIVAMAFDGWPEGTDPWNVRNDVEAWRVVLESRAPLVVGDATVTKRHLALTPMRARQSLAARGAAGAYLAQLLADWLDEQGPLAASRTGSENTWPIWDEVAVAYLLGLTTTEIHPRPALRDDLGFDHSRTRGTITWVTTIDAGRLWDDLEQKLDRARRQP